MTGALTSVVATAAASAPAEPVGPCACGCAAGRHRPKFGADRVMGRGSCKECDCDEFLPAVDGSPVSLAAVPGSLDVLDPMCVCGDRRRGHRLRKWYGRRRDSDPGAGQRLQCELCSRCLDFTPAACEKCRRRSNLVMLPADAGSDRVTVWLCADGCPDEARS